MIYNYEEVLKIYKSDYQIKKAIKNNEIFKIEKGIYSTKKYNSYLEIITKKYPNAIFTFDSAYYYHNLTDVIPDNYFLATDRDAYKIKDKKIRQIFITKKYFEIGKSSILVNGIKINIYDKEKMLIELVKNKRHMPYDYYKEIILNYRELVNDIDMEKLENYLSMYKNKKSLFNTIQSEVF